MTQKLHTSHPAFWQSQKLRWLLGEESIFSFQYSVAVLGVRLLAFLKKKINSPSKHGYFWIIRVQEIGYSEVKK